MMLQADRIGWQRQTLDRGYVDLDRWSYGEELILNRDVPVAQRLVKARKERLKKESEWNPHWGNRKLPPLPKHECDVRDLPYYEDCYEEGFGPWW